MTKEKQLGTDGDGAPSTGTAQTLRRHAEAIAREKAFQIPENIGNCGDTLPQGVSTIAQMLHELRVHQIELEMQNDELRQIQGKLEASRVRYFDLYDLAPVGYFTLNEQGLILEANLTAADLLGVTTGALVRQPITRLIFKKDQDLYYKNLKQLFESGEAQACELRMVKKDAAPVWVRIDSILAKDTDGMPICRITMIDITDRKQSEEQLQKSLEQLRRAVQTTIQVLVMAVEMKDPYTAGHQRRMTDLARTIATDMDLPPKKIEGLRMAGVIHDVGKITLPTEILSKPTKLSAIELSLIREHARLGYDILKDVESPWPLAEMVYQHHERMDGSGYPRGLKREEILIEARFLAVADVVEAMASHRPYRAALGLDAALEEIEKNRGTLYDEAVVDTCLRRFREKGYRFAEG